jgi:uncharacterized Zn-binding protein involved in type VI secretion
VSSPSEILVPLDALGPPNEAARVTDPLTHDSVNKLLAMAGAAVAGAALAAILVIGAPVAAVAATVAMTACAGASLGATVGELAATLLSSQKETGKIESPGAERTLIGSQRAARITDLVKCDRHDHKPLVRGSATVIIEDHPASRAKDRTKCDSPIERGMKTVFIGGPTTESETVDDEVPWFVHAGVTALGIVSGVGAIALAQNGLRAITAYRLAGSLVGSTAMGSASSAIARRCGEKPAAVAGLLGSLLGGGLGGGRALAGKAVESVYNPPREAVRPSDVGQYFREHVSRVVDKTEVAYRVAKENHPDEVADIDPKTLSDYAKVHDLAKFRKANLERLHEYFGVSKFEKPEVGKLIDDINRGDQKVTEVFFRRRGITDPKVIEQYDSLVHVADLVDRPSEYTSRWYEMFKKDKPDGPEAGHLVPLEPASLFLAKPDPKTRETAPAHIIEIAKALEEIYAWRVPDAYRLAWDTLTRSIR